MIQIENTLVSFDVFEKKFCCDIAACRGACCVEGDSGAPLKEEEVLRIEQEYEQIKPYMKPEGIKAIEEQGYFVFDTDKDVVTPLIAGRECAYAIDEDGSCWCAIEKSWTEGKSTFRKPESCHLYPIRIVNYGEFEALNYHKWEVCAAARAKGHKAGIPVYRFLKEALIAKYGEEWYEQLEYAAGEIEKGNIEVTPG